MKKIATQAWLATIFEPAEAWAIVRRTGLTPKDATYTPAVVNKLPYPDHESTNDNANWQAITGRCFTYCANANQGVWDAIVSHMIYPIKKTDQ